MQKLLRPGIDVYSDRLAAGGGAPAIALVANQSSVTSSLEYSHVLLSRHARLQYIFSPQHGFFGTEQANMVESPDAKDPITGTRIVSLYSTTRKISPRYFRNIDALVFDLQDVGARYYTYLWTLYFCMQACEKHATTLTVLDRPNPINGISIEGNRILREFTSFVGLHPVPNRYGLTIGEFATMLKDLVFRNVNLEVMRMEGWSRASYLDEYDNEWIPASPNIPTVNTAVVYPGMCLFEGTNLSEGRGTTRPFEIVGAPFINAHALAQHLNALHLDGVVFRPLLFRPTFDKFKGKTCGGVFLHVVDRSMFRSLRTAMTIIATVREMYPRHFRWFRGAYEYERKIPAIDLLYGSDELRKVVDSGDTLSPLFRECESYEVSFAGEARSWRLYD